MLRSKPVAREEWTMIELMLIACLLSEPQRCQQHFVPTEASLSMMECIVSG
jgi:hypothetical protein